ncbi:MAG: tetratricopeptide repeat protein [Myxococcales bacterium]|nr:tetratricopeptide repeat protein [Myxococcales bacterium]
MTRGRELAVLAVIALSFAISLGRATSYAFVWDDVKELETNAAFDRPLLEGLSLTQTERTDPELTTLSTIELAYDSYRPLLFASFWIDIQLFGRSAGALHAVNLALGLVGIALAYLVLRRWLAPPRALIATAVFALHPVQIEAVAYISARGDLLAGVLALACVLACLRAIARPRSAGPRSGAEGGAEVIDAERPALWVGLAALAFAASLLAKEAYLALPVAIAALAWQRDRLRARWWVPASLALVIVAYLVLRAAMVTSTTGGAISAALAALPGILLQYLRIVVLPFDLSTERLLDGAYTVPGWLVAAAALALIVWLGTRASPSARRGPAGPGLAKPAVAGLVWFGALLAPSAIAIASQRVVADRYAYLAVLGLAAAGVWGAAELIAARPRLRVPLVAVGALWGALLLVVGWRQVPVWTDNATLYTNAAAMAPASSSAQYRLGVLETQRGRWPEAIAQFEAALALDERNVLAWNNLGVGRLRTGDPAGAAAALTRAVELAPAHFRAFYNLGLAKLALGDSAGGCAAIRRALAINPTYQPARAEVTSAGGRCSP